MRLSEKEKILTVDPGDLPLQIRTHDPRKSYILKSTMRGGVVLNRLDEATPKKNLDSKLRGV